MSRHKLRAVTGRPSSPTDLPFVPSLEDAAVIQLTDRQRQELVGMATRLRLPPRTVPYEADSPAKYVFVVTEGVVKTFRDLPSGKRRITAFLYARDIFGLSKNERYVNTAQAVTRVTLYRIPLDPLRDVLKRDGDLQFKFLRKITHELREAQQRSVIVGRRDAIGRVAMFLTMTRKKAEASSVSPTDTIPLPMNRSDIADFLALSLEAVSRATAELERRQLVEFEARLARVLDEKRLAKLAAAL
jgi:CRP/FNR family transcriptional regulator, anaerobic regulatory protein